MYLLVWVCFFNHFLVSPSTKSHSGCTLFARHFFLPPFPPQSKALIYRTASVPRLAPFSYMVCFCSPLRPRSLMAFRLLFPPDWTSRWWKCWRRQIRRREWISPGYLFLYALFWSMCMYSDLAVVLNARLMLLRVAPYEPHLSLLHVGLCSREGEQAHSRARAGRKWWRHIVPH